MKAASSVEEKYRAYDPSARALSVSVAEDCTGQERLLKLCLGWLYPELISWSQQAFEMGSQIWVVSRQASLISVILLVYERCPFFCTGSQAGKIGSSKGWSLKTQSIEPKLRKILRG